MFCKGEFWVEGKAKYFGNGFVARILLLMLRLRDLEYSAGSG